MSDPASNFDASIEFLRWWRPGGPWVLMRITPDKKGLQTRTFREETIGALRAWVDESVRTHNIYFHVNPTTRDLIKKAEREDVAALAWLHVDIDPRAGENLDAERARALELLTTRLPPDVPPPSAIVFSGGGYQGFWRLANPMPINGQPAAYEDAKRYNQQLELLFGADHCHNVDRIMRLPGTINWPTPEKLKKGRVAALAEVVSFNSNVFQLSQFTKARLIQSVAGGESLPQPSRLPRTSVATLALRVLDLSELDQYGVPDRLRVIAMQGLQPGEAKKGDSSRSAWLHDFCCNMIRCGVPDELIFAIITDPKYAISASILDKGSSAERYATRQIERAHLAVSSSPLVIDRAEPTKSARLFVALRRPTLLHYNGDWLAYERAAHLEMEDGTIKSELYAFLDAAFVATKEGTLVPFRPSRSKVADVEEAMKATTHRPRDIFEPPCWLGDGGPPAGEIVACQNGLLHLPSGVLHPPSEEFFTRNALDFDFDPNAPAPERWQCFLDEIWPEGTGEAKVLQETFGYLLVPDTSQQKIFLLVGPKRSGKGTIGRILGRLIGARNRCGPSLDELGGPFGLQPLIGKQLALVSDMRAGTKADAAKITENLLRISGEDEVTVARKYKSAWTGRLNTRFVIMTNEMPSISDASGALASRYVPLEMRESFYGREDAHLAAKLIDELPGILNWALEGWRRLNQRGHFALPDSARDVVDQLEDLASPVKAFIRDRCELTPNAEASKERVYSAYCDWCRNHNVYAYDSARFANQLMAATDRRVRPSRINRGGVRSPHWIGIELRGELPPPF